MMAGMKQPTNFARVAGVAIAALGLACATQPLEGFDPAIITVQESTPLTGSALAQRKSEMQRAHSDMQSMFETMDGIASRQDLSGVAVFSEFVEKYLSGHVGPLLQPGWQSTHAELIQIDANLRVLRSALLLQMRRFDAFSLSLDDLKERYDTRVRLLVEFPAGQQLPLGEVVGLLEDQLAMCAAADQKWGRGARGRNARVEVRERTACAGLL
jgi:hypothetical protein